MSTPLKFSKPVCVVCGKSKPDRYSLLQSSHSLKQLIFRYCEIDVAEGIVCRNCSRQLNNLHEKVCQLKHQAMRVVSSVHGKRLVSHSSPVSVKRISKESESPKLVSPSKIPVRVKTVDNVNVNNEHYRSPPTSSTPSKIPAPRLTVSRSVAKRALFSVSKPRFAEVAAVQVTEEHAEVAVVQVTEDHVEVGVVQVTEDYAEVTAVQVTEDHAYAAELPALLPTPVPSDTSVSTNENALIQHMIKSFADWLRRPNNKASIDNARERFAKLHKWKHGNKSVLCSRSTDQFKLESLVQFSWCSIVHEFMTEFPELFHCLLGLMTADLENSNLGRSMLPRLAMIYSVVLQSRASDMSLLQRMVSLVFLNSNAEFHVYEQLSPLGLCLTHKNTLRLCDLLACDLNRQLIDAIKSKKTISIVGDNVNFTTHVRDERRSRHGRMHHFFGSAVLTHNLDFSRLSAESPQLPADEMKAGLFIPDCSEQEELVYDYAIMAMKVAAKYMEFFKKVDFPRHRVDEYTHQLASKTGIIPLHVLPLNEQHYGDVVQILSEYVSKMEAVFQEAGVDKDNMPNVLIGGDQLTRERFSSAKLLRLGVSSPSDRFAKLTPVASHFFHMGMKMLKVCFKRLWSSAASDTSTLHAQKIRLQRSEVKLEVKDAYNPCKDFFISVVEAYILEAVLTYFGMEDVTSVPTLHEIPTDDHLLSSWAMGHFQAMVKQHVGTFTYKSVSQQNSRGATSTGHLGTSQLPSGKPVVVVLRDGRRLLVTPNRQQLATVKPDCLNNYAQLVLELGMCFKNFVECVKVPNRLRMLRTLKVMLMILKADSFKSKYGDEIIRFLVLQYQVLSQKDAHCMFYQMFVNTTGKIDGNIPADLQMEFLVKVYKKHIKHMMSNKRESNISKRVSALAGLNKIIENFDECTVHSAVSNRHSTASKTEDELTILADLRAVQPFVQIAGRELDGFKSAEPSLLSMLDSAKYIQWLGKRSLEHAKCFS